MRVFPGNMCCVFIPRQSELQPSGLEISDLWETAARSKDEMMRCQIKVRASWEGAYLSHHGLGCLGELKRTQKLWDDAVV